MPSFEPPEWASPPQSTVSLQVNGATIRTDEKPYYVMGSTDGAQQARELVYRDKETVDVHLVSDAVSRNHAAIVHHTTGKVYIIDLQSSHGTFINGSKLETHKPTKLQDGQEIQFGGLQTKYTVKMSSSASGTMLFIALSACGMGAPVSYRASHLLVKHANVRNPRSWKEEVVTRSEQEALQMIEGFHAQLVTGDPGTLPQRFADLAKVESHCSSAKRGGDLGSFGPGQMMKSFEEATAVLRPGELSGPVFSDSGVHLILRTA